MREICLYDEIFEAWKREKNSVTIQRLPVDFFEKASTYLSDLRSLLPKSSEEVSAELAKNHEIEYVEFMISSLLKMRARKIALISLENLVEIPLNLVQSEVSLINDLREDLKAYLEQCVRIPRKDTGKVISSLEREQGSILGSRETSNIMLLRILQPLPKLVGVDLEEYGPFEQEDLVVLPKENALVLIARGMASEVKSATEG
jgi:DNA replication factor GINS